MSEEAKKPAPKATSTETRVKHFYLKQSILLDGKDMQKAVSETHHPGIKMSLHPAGVLCRKGKKRFIVPYESCGAITLEDSDDGKA